MRDRLIEAISQKQNGDKKNFRKVCSYSCHNAARNKSPKNKWELKREKMNDRDKEIYRLYLSGVSCDELSVKYGLCKQRIWRIIVCQKAKAGE